MKNTQIKPAPVHVLSLAALAREPKPTNPAHKTLAELGAIMVAECGKDACASGYQINADDLEEVGRQALSFGDIRRDGTLN